jgi:hypothetical protein
MDLHERLNSFLERLTAASACGAGQEALALVCRLIEEVEEEFCRITRVHPPPLTFTGRMYPPQSDHLRVRDDGTIVATPGSTASTAARTVRLQSSISRARRLC